MPRPLFFLKGKTRPAPPIAILSEQEPFDRLSDKAAGHGFSLVEFT